MDVDGSEAPLLSRQPPSPRSHKQVNAVYRRIARRLLPVAFTSMLLYSLTRSNLSFAEMGMASDIGISKSEFGTASSLYFVTFTSLQIPSTAALEWVGGPIWLGFIIVGFGLSSSAIGLVTNVAQLYILRMLLGAFQAGVYAGFVSFLTQFFPDSRMGVACGIMIAGSFAGVGIAGPLYAVFLSLGGKFGSWRWMLGLQGLLASLLGVWVLLLPKTPKALLSESQHAVWKLGVEGTDVVKSSSTTPTPMLTNIPYLVKTVVLSLNIWAITVSDIFVCMLRHTATVWTPLWIDAMLQGNGVDWDQGDALSKPNTQILVALISGIPFALSGVGSWLFAWSAHRLQDRTFHLSAMRLTAGLSFVLLPWLADVSVALGFVALTIGHICINGGVGICMSLSLSFLDDDNKGFGVAWMTSIANLGGVLGPMVAGFLADISGSYKSTMRGVGALGMVAGIIMLTLEDSVRKEACQKRRQCSTTAPLQA